MASGKIKKLIERNKSAEELKLFYKIVNLQKTVLLLVMGETKSLILIGN